MAQSVVFNGSTYSIPEAREVGWSALTDYLVDLANAQVAGGPQKANQRVATTTPITMLTTDYVVISKLAAPGAVAANLPAGVNEQLMLVVDGTGDAATNNITINRNGADTINGATTFVLRDNRAAVLMQYSASLTNWVVLGIYKENILTRASSDTGANKVSNKDFDDETTNIVDSADVTKKINFEPGGQATATVTTIATSSTVARTITVPDATDTLVGKATADILTNKDIDGGAASNSLRITIPKNTAANLTALTRKQGTLVYDTTNNVLKYDDGSSLNAIASSAVATATAAGIVTSFFPTITSGISTVSSANATQTVSDGFLAYHFSTANSNRTLTLQAVATSAGRRVIVKKTDSGTGTVVITPNGGTIDGDSTYTLISQYDSVTLVSDGANWFVVSGKQILYQRKFLSADVTSTTADITSLKFSALSVGKVYRLSGQVKFNAAAAGTRSAVLIAKNNSVDLAVWKASNATGQETIMGGPIIFVAAATTLVFSSVNTTADINGDGTADTTWMVLEELNNYSVSTKFT